MMLADLRIAAFVEGSIITNGDNQASNPAPITARDKGSTSPNRDNQDHFIKIWQEIIPQNLQITRFDQIFPISKLDLLAMDSAAVAKSGIGGLALDRLMATKLRENPFDTAVVIWDLKPPWRSEDLPSGKRHWEESLRLYECFSRSTVLPDPWKASARRRFEEMSSRACPGHAR